MNSVLTDPALEAFRGRLRGPLLAGTDPGFHEAASLWNGEVSTRPAPVVRRTGAADVVVAVDFAQEGSYCCRAERRTQHRWYCPDRRRPDHRPVPAARDSRGPEQRSATVQAGCLLGDVDRETQLHGLAVPPGFRSEVGVAG